MATLLELTNALRALKDALKHLHTASGAMQNEPAIAARLEVLIRSVETEASLVWLLIRGAKD